MTRAEDFALARALNDHALRADLPAGAAAARQLSARLTAPVQIAVVGGPGTGKSTLCDLLAHDHDLALRKVMLGGTNADARGTDIVIFCGTEFGPDERRFWDGLAPAQRDHAFFALTSADRLAVAGQLAAFLAAIDAVAGDLMQGIFPLATTMARVARKKGDGTGLRTSGGAALLQAVDRQVAVGRGAARDAAQLFLSRHAGVMRHAVAVVPPRPPPPFAEWHASREKLDVAARGWADLATIPDHDRPRAILDRACMLAQDLCDLAPQGAGDSLSDELATVADMVQLMRAEGGAAAATDALMLLTQLRGSIAFASTSEPGQ